MAQPRAVRICLNPAGGLPQDVEGAGRAGEGTTLRGVKMLMLCLLFGASCFQIGTASAVVTLDDTVRHQTMKGWEAAVLPTVRDDYLDDLPGFGSLFEQAAGDLNITRVRIDVFSGTEGRPGWGASYLSGALTELEMVRGVAYDIINDNDDPNLADLRGFEFALLDWQMDHLIVPYKREVERRGGTLFTYLAYIDQNRSKFRHLNNPAEYAELMLVLFDHLQARYGFVPDAIDVANEPDFYTATTGTAMGRVVVATAARLAAAGFHPQFIGPSVVNRSKAVAFFDDMVAVPGAAAHLTELSYHCYYDSAGDSRAAIGERAARAGIGSTQNECWEERNTHVELHRDLKAGRAAAWQQGTFKNYYKVDRTTWQASLNERTKIKRQYFHYIRPGDVRIDAATTDQALDPVAFIRPDGGRVVVVLAMARGTVSIAPLPPGLYEVTYSTSQEFDVHLPDVEVRGGEAVTVTIPKDGVLTVAAKAPPGA